MDNITLSVGVLGRLTGKTKEELLKLTQKEDGTALEPSEIESNISTLFAERLKKVESDAAGKALKNGLEKREKEIAKSLGIETFTPEDLIEQIKAKKGEGGDASEIQKENAKLKKDIADLQGTVAKAKADFEQQSKKLASDALYQRALNQISQKAETLGLKLPTDPAARKKRIEKLVKAELQGKTLKEDGGEIVFLDADGNIETDELKHPIKLSQYSESLLMEYFDKADSNNAGGNPPTGAGTHKNGKHNFTKEQLTTEGYIKTAKELQAKNDKEGIAALDTAFAQQYEK